MEIKAKIEVSFGGEYKKVSNTQKLLDLLFDNYEPEILKDILEQIQFRYSQSLITTLTDGSDGCFGKKQGEIFNQQLYVLNELKNAIGQLTYK